MKKTTKEETQKFLKKVRNGNLILFKTLQEEVSCPIIARYMTTKQKKDPQNYISIRDPVCLRKPIRFNDEFLIHLDFSIKGRDYYSFAKRLYLERITILASGKENIKNTLISINEDYKIYLDWIKNLKKPFLRYPFNNLKRAVLTEDGEDFLFDRNLRKEELYIRRILNYPGLRNRERLYLEKLDSRQISLCNLS